MVLVPSDFGLHSNIPNPKSKIYGSKIDSVINTNLIAPLLIKKALPAAIKNGDGMNSGI